MRWISCSNSNRKEYGAALAIGYNKHKYFSKEFIEQFGKTNTNFSGE